MQSFKESYLESQSFYKPGDMIKFTQAEVAKYNDASVMGGFDWGTVASVSGTGYKVKLDNGNEITVQNDHAYAYGNADEA